MAIDTNKVIKRNSTGVGDLIRDFWQSFIQEKVYNESVVRNLAGAVRYINAYGDGFSNTYQWNISNGLVNPDFDVADSDIVLAQSEYSTTSGNVDAVMKGTFVSYREDVLSDQVQFIGTDISNSLVAEMAKIENTMFFTKALTAGEVTGATVVAPVSMTLENLHLGVVDLEKANADALYILMSPTTAHSIQPELSDVSKSGDNSFLRRNAVGMLYGATVIKTNYLADGKVLFLGNEGFVHYDRLPYTLNIAKNSNINLTLEFAIKARFGIELYRASNVKVGTYTL